MHVHQTDLAGVLLLQPKPHYDARGWFSRTFDAATARHVGIDPAAFVQDSQSRSLRGVVRGLHGRMGSGEAKLVRCSHGAIFDVVVDIRIGSPTFGRWATFTLDDDQMQTLYIPRGFLHGFQALTESSDTCYRIDAEHDPAEDIAVRWDDPGLGIPWPLPPTQVSERDLRAGAWADLRRLLG
ncbi:dTDP-4-dehydrorhamnose 3,5-epimerase [Pseudonocardia nigra]|uniref:dTDP-4-dehydrorhamnose 3,5-epimerase n=1 Tax=Pseudonocardia nigra TaxID=1921578 RepID=UPI001C5D1959|nr:dTDP-4-dehydrorhamnose 3,5-epimerase [Pseudonocardia nigra]